MALVKSKFLLVELSKDNVDYQTEVINGFSGITKGTIGIFCFRYIKGCRLASSHPAYTLVRQGPG